ncbi:beta-1,3-galactosyltransferase brn [Nephila pilipes]|uniref:Hexosyltransferase n=1 Tax=Nephila pilipes TaxID=299642 RepID=A0A8X6MFG2_NEPPI|nr:beta-1,3-galactosyltransferase brn [Nephila pilipes]
MAYILSKPFRFLTNKVAILIFIATLVIFIDYYGILLHLFEVNYSEFSYPLHIDMETVLEELKKGHKPTYHPINEYDYPYRIQNSKKCSQRSYFNYENVVILFVIKSALPNENKRNAIRKLWGSENRFPELNIRRIFLLGISTDPLFQDKIDEEYEKHKDLVQADFIDSYYNNTIKTMIGFKWVIQNCPNAQFIMFADDDMYVSTKNLLKFISDPFNKNRKPKSKRDLTYILVNEEKGFVLVTEGNIIRTIWNRRIATRRHLFQIDPFEERLFAGYVFFSSPMRHKSSKWYISLTDYPFSKYPPYVTAGAYVLSFKALEDLYYTSMYTKNFKFDDVYLGIVAKKCGISPLHNKHFYFWRKRYNKYSYREVIASHGFDDPDELTKIWEEQKNLGNA